MISNEQNQKRTYYRSLWAYEYQYVGGDARWWADLSLNYLTKKILGEIEHIFQRLKNSSETKLNAFPGISSSQDLNGYLFVGNNTKDYFSLLFEEQENDDVINYR